MARIWCGSRSPSGERGLKCVGHGHLAHVVLSLPIRGAWIERNVCATTRRPSPGSLPIRGAWIDISRTCGTASAPPCRSPSGERGLKSEMDVQQHDLGQSLPIRGAWIEIRNIARRSVRHGCRSPSGGAWVEITCTRSARTRTRSSLPIRGAWIEITWTTCS